MDFKVRAANLNRGSAAVATSLVMAIACITAGFVMFRLSVRGPVDATPQIAQLPSAGTDEPFTKRPEGSTAVVPDSTPTTVILNPGTADASKTAEASKGPTRPGSNTGAGFSDSQPVRTSRRTGEHTIQDEDRGEPSTERDYRALRDYTLRRQ